MAGTGDGASAPHGTGTPGIGILGSMILGIMMHGMVLGATTTAIGAATTAILTIMDIMAGADLTTDISSMTGEIQTAGPVLAECLLQAMLPAVLSAVHPLPGGLRPEM